MAFYSKRHYRMVSPRPDTAADIAERKDSNAASQQAYDESLAKFGGVVTPENFRAMDDYRQARYKELMRQKGYTHV